MMDEYNCTMCSIVDPHNHSVLPYENVSIHQTFLFQSPVPINVKLINHMLIHLGNITKQYLKPQ